MELKELLMKTRSYRSFDESVTFTREQLAEFVDHARFVPNTKNCQTMRYRLVYTPEEVAKVRPLTIWAKQLKGMTLPPEGHHATAFIVVCQDLDSKLNEKNFMKDVGISAHTILLAVAEAGFGGCMIGSFSAAKVSEALDIPERYQPCLVLAIGKPDEKVVIVPLGEDGDIKYYRDEEGTHYVPKRALEDVIL